MKIFVFLSLVLLESAVFASTKIESKVGAAKFRSDDGQVSTNSLALSFTYIADNQFAFGASVSNSKKIKSKQTASEDLSSTLGVGYLFINDILPISMGTTFTRTEYMKKGTDFNAEKNVQGSRLSMSANKAHENRINAEMSVFLPSTASFKPFLKIAQVVYSDIRVSSKMELEVSDNTANYELSFAGSNYRTYLGLGSSFWLNKNLSLNSEFLYVRGIAKANASDKILNIDVNKEVTYSGFTGSIGLAHCF